MSRTASSLAAPVTPAGDELPQVEVSWSPQGCLLEMSGLLTRSLLDHTRDLVCAQTRSGTCLTVRLADAVVTRDLISMLIAARRYLLRIGSRLVIDAPDRALPPGLLRALAAGDQPTSLDQPRPDAS